MSFMNWMSDTEIVGRGVSGQYGYITSAEGTCYTLGAQFLGINGQGRSFVRPYIFPYAENHVGVIGINDPRYHITPEQCVAYRMSPGFSPTPTRPPNAEDYGVVMNSLASLAYSGMKAMASLDFRAIILECYRQRPEIWEQLRQNVRPLVKFKLLQFAGFFVVAFGILLAALLGNLLGTIPVIITTILAAVTGIGMIGVGKVLHLVKRPAIVLEQNRLMNQNQLSTLPVGYLGLISELGTTLDMFAQ